MLGRRKTKSAAASIEATIAGLETTKAALEARVPILEAEKSAALDRRREALISGDDTTEAAKAARVAEDDLAAVADALQEVERRIGDAVAQLDADRARARREEVAGALESDANKVADATAAMASAVEAVVKAHARMMLAVSGRAAPQLMERREHLSPKDFANGVLLQAIVAALPEVEIHAEVFPDRYTRSGRVDGRGAREAGEAAAARLREVAVRVRNDELPADLPEWQAKRPAIRSVSEPATVPVHPLRCFSWVDDKGQARRSTPCDCYHPEPVAEAALATGVAKRVTDLETARARAEWESRRERVPLENLFDGVEVVDLGVNLQDARRAEERRQHAEQTAAWQAAQEAERAELERRAA